ncbi:MAG TPA: DUF2238 domain-containing protein [Candidatus Paceibacterota bacterium]|nr:DUF2238 domain-containing protein [Candidatus Paceibacterota bacterium]
MFSFKYLLLFIFLAVFIWSAINPELSYAYWFLENSLLFVVMVLAVIFYRKLKLSDLSLGLITFYLIFPLVASHYGVAGVPIGDTIGQWFGSDNNLYNRLVHFIFGLTAFYPILELLVNNGVFEKNSFKAHIFTFTTILALSALYEIFEWLAAISVNPALAEAFYAAQEDIFDGQKDMALSTIGALVSGSLSYIFSFAKEARKAYV